MALGSILQHISFPSTCQFMLSFPYFAIFYFLFHKPKILLYHLSIYIISHFANNNEVIDNPFVALGSSWCLFVQVFGGLLRCLLLDRYLGSQKLREILTLLCYITLSSSREKSTQAQEVAAPLPYLECGRKEGGGGAPLPFSPEEGKAGGDTPTLSFS